VACSEKLAMAMELPNTSCIHRMLLADGVMTSAVSMRRRSWLSRGLDISRCSPNCTGCL
jgi:hypothetical protein